MAEIYTFTDVQRLTGVERQHLSRWVDLGMIAPDHGGGGVSGSHRKFSFRNLFAIAVAVEFQRYRVHIGTIQAVLQELSDWDPETAEDKNLVERQLQAKGDNEFKLWRRLKSSSRRGDTLAFIVLESDPHDVITPSQWRISFLSSLQHLEEQARNRESLPGVFPELKGVTSIVIDARAVLVRLEQQTGDQL